MTNDPSAQVTQLLKNYCNGNREALKELLPLIYNQLHKLARQQRYFQRKDHTLNTTALMHEAYLKLVNHPDPSRGKPDALPPRGGQSHAPDPRRLCQAATDR